MGLQLLLLASSIFCQPSINLLAMETYDEYIGQDLLCAFSFSNVSESATYMRPLYIIRSDGRMDQITNGPQAFPNYGRIFVPMHRDLKRETLLYRVVIMGKLDPANSYDRSEQYVGRCQDTLRVTPFTFDDIFEKEKVKVISLHKEKIIEAYNDCSIIQPNEEQQKAKKKLSWLAHNYHNEKAKEWNYPQYVIFSNEVPTPDKFS